MNTVVANKYTTIPMTMCILNLDLVIVSAGFIQHVYLYVL
jgi:hypothetical protein